MIQTALGLDTRDLKRGKAEFDATFRDMAASAKVSFSGIAGALGLGISAAGSWQFLRQTADELDAIGKASRRANMNSTDYQVLAEAFKMGAGSAEELAMSLTKVQALMGMAERGDERSTGIFARLGIDFRDLKKLAPDQLLQLLSRRIMQIRDENGRTTAAVEIFGEKGMKTVEILAGGLERLRTEMANSGRLFDEQAISDAEAFNDSLTKLNRSFKSLAASIGAIGAMKWVADAAEWTSRLPGMISQGKKEGASGFWASGTNQAIAFAADFISFGLASHLAGKLGSGDRPVYSTGPGPGELNLVDLHRLNQSDPAEQERQQRQRLADGEKRYAEWLKRRDAAEAVFNKALKPLEFSKAADAQASKDRIEAEKLLPQIYKDIEKTGYQLTEQEKATIRTRVQLALETRRAQEAHEKFSRSLKESLGPMREALLSGMGLGNIAEYERALRELEKAKGAPLTAEEQKQAARLGDLRYRQSMIGVNRQEFDTEIRSNELASLGGWYSSVVMPDAESINANILTEAQQMRTLLEEIKTELDRITIVGG